MAYYTVAHLLHGEAGFLHMRGVLTRQSVADVQGNLDGGQGSPAKIQERI